jgi:SDR family mycofactocin-dependent oxidoreductase
MGTLEGQVALITGGARGQGRTHAVTLAKQGADVALCDRCADMDTIGYGLASAEDLAETVTLVEKEGRRCVAAEMDVRDPAALGALVGQVEATFGRLDVLVANAGVCATRGVADVTDAEWADIVGTNLTGVFHAIRAVAPVMMAQGSGRIVATSSMMGRMGAPQMTAYVASKWGVIGLVKSAAQDLAPYGVTVNAVAPGNIATPMVQNDTLYKTVRPDLESPTWDDVAPVLQMGHVLPTPLLDPYEVSDVVLFLVGPQGRHITGAVIDISAGASARFTA